MGFSQTIKADISAGQQHRSHQISSPTSSFPSVAKSAMSFGPEAVPGQVGHTGVVGVCDGEAVGDHGDDHQLRRYARLDPVLPEGLGGVLFASPVLGIGKNYNVSTYIF